MGSACLEVTCPVKSLSTEGTAYEEDFFGGDESRAFQPRCRVKQGAAICYLSPTWRLICAENPENIPDNEAWFTYEKKAPNALDHIEGSQLSWAKDA